MNELWKQIDNTFSMVPAVIDSMFDTDFFKPSVWTGKNASVGYPMNVVRLTENNITTGYRLEYALAGFSKDDIRVSLSGDTLHIEAERRQEKPENEVSEYRGISYKKLSMSYKLMRNADRKGIQSRFRDGLLSITIPVVRDGDESGSEVIEIQ